MMTFASYHKGVDEKSSQDTGRLESTLGRSQVRISLDSQKSGLTFSDNSSSFAFIDTLFIKWEKSQPKKCKSRVLTLIAALPVSVTGEGVRKNGSLTVGSGSNPALPFRSYCDLG